MKQTDRVINYLKTHKYITHYEAVTELGIADLAGCMRDLRELGYTTDAKFVKSINRYGDEIKYKQYWIVSEPKRKTLHLNFSKVNVKPK